MSQRTNRRGRFFPAGAAAALAALACSSAFWLQAEAQRHSPPLPDERVDVECSDSGATPETANADLSFKLPPLGTEGIAQLRRAVGAKGTIQSVVLACERNTFGESDRTTLFDIAVCQGSQEGLKYVVTLQWGGFTQEFGAHLEAHDGFSAFFFCRARSAIIPSW